MSRETATAEAEKEYLPILKYVMILSEKGIPTTLESVGNGMAIGSIDTTRDEKGNWMVAKHEMLIRIKASTKKLPPIEPGYYSIAGFIYYCSEAGVDIHEDNICHLIANGNMTASVDDYGRFIIPQHELDKRIEQFGEKK